MEKFDHLYVSITQEVGGLEGLFTSLFSFLLRRTDFFYESEPGDKMGFPPGVNEKMLLSIFNRFRDIHYKSNPRKSVDEYAEKYVKYAKQHGLPLPEGVSPEESKKEQSKQSVGQKKAGPVQVTKPKIAQKKEEKLEVVKKSEDQVVQKKEEQKKSEKDNSMFTDIR